MQGCKGSYFNLCLWSTNWILQQKYPCKKKQKHDFFPQSLKFPMQKKKQTNSPRVHVAIVRTFQQNVNGSWTRLQRHTDSARRKTSSLINLEHEKNHLTYHQKSRLFVELFTFFDFIRKPQRGCLGIRGSSVCACVPNYNDNESKEKLTRVTPCHLMLLSHLILDCLA